MSEARNKPSAADVPSSDSRAVTGARLTGPQTDPVASPEPLPEPVSDPAHLRVVTVAPSGNSFPDIEAPSRDRRDPYVGAVIDGRYRVETVIGEGGMGVVYRCVHTIIGKKLALKVLRADLARDGEVTERFLNEAKSASAIGNPHIIDISDFGQLPDGSTYFVMEYLSGTALTGLVDGFVPVPEERILNVGRQLGEALSAAHAAGIVHRDLKPDNIFLIERGTEKDFVKILDFGIAKVSNTAGKLTRAGAVFGTPHYMCPEQAAGLQVDHRGDIYSVGVILYELTTGRVPFDADNFMGVLTQHMYKAPRSVREIAPATQHISPGLEAVITKCLAKRPEHRYQSMNELVADIDRLRVGAAPVAIRGRAEDFTAPGNYYDHGAASGRAGRKRTALILVLLAALAIAAFLLVRGGPGRNPERPTVTREPVKPAPPEPAAAAPTPTAQPAKPAGTRQVLIASTPGDARIFRGDQDLGSSPVGIDVPHGESVELTLRAAGHKDARVIIDGSEPRQLIQLERVASKPKVVKAPAPASKPTVKRPALGSDIVDPWGK
jgi:tRNA A-37 threonylcarbamoyl transferase component Bud32